MKRFPVLALIIALVGSAGCGNPTVVAEAFFTNEANGGKDPLAHLPIRLLPYDRDLVFDSLEAAFGKPEPAIPPELLALQREVEAAELAWIEEQVRWSAVRDSSEVVSEQIDEMATQGQAASLRYRQSVERRSRLEAEEQQVNQRTQAAFARFDRLRRQSLGAGDSIRTERQRWAAAAYSDFPGVAAERIRALGLAETAGVTDGDGTASFQVAEGRWWVYARYTQRYEDLYWNIPIEVTGDSIHVILNRENARITPVI